VRIPAGVRATCAGEAIAGAQRLGEPITLQLGRVAVRVARVEDPALALAHSRLDRRPPVYHAVSLVVHLRVWAAAALRGVPPAPHKQPPRIVRHPVLAHVKVVPPPPPPPPPTKRERVAARAHSAQEQTQLHVTPEQVAASADDGPHFPPPKNAAEAL